VHENYADLVWSILSPLNWTLSLDNWWNIHFQDDWWLPNADRDATIIKT
jgi:hypothetical protein